MDSKKATDWTADQTDGNIALQEAILSVSNAVNTQCHTFTRRPYYRQNAAGLNWGVEKYYTSPIQNIMRTEPIAWFADKE